MRIRRLKKNNYSKPGNGEVSNYFFNVMIFILSGLIIFVGFSIYTKIRGNSEADKLKSSDDKISEIIQVEVLNGCGIEGVADRFTYFLRDHNYDVVSSSNYQSFDIDETIIIDRIGNRANAMKTAELLGVKPSKVIQQINHEYFLDVSIVIGKDYNKLLPLN